MKVIIRQDEMTAVTFRIPVDNHGSAVAKAEQGGLFTLRLRTNKSECAFNYRGIT